MLFRMVVRWILVAVVCILLKYTCKGQSLYRPPLVGITRYGMFLFEENSLNGHLLKLNPNDMWMVSIDFHYEKQLIFLGLTYEERVSNDRGKIMSAKLVNGSLSEQKIIVTTGPEPQVAVDWVNDKLYWQSMKTTNDQNGYIYVSNLDGSGVSVFYSIQYIDRFSVLQLDPLNRKIYFMTLPSGKSKYHDLKQIDMSLNTVPVTIDTCDTGTDKLCAFVYAIDKADNGKVYWMNGDESLVKSVNSDGGDPQSYNFAAYETIYKPFNITTLNLFFENAHKGCLYGDPMYGRYRRGAKMGLMIPANETVVYTTFYGLNHFRIFHPSAQPISK